MILVEDKMASICLRCACTDIGRCELSYDVRGTNQYRCIVKRKTETEYVDALSRVLRFKQTQEDAVYFTILGKINSQQIDEETRSKILVPSSQGR